MIHIDEGVLNDFIETAIIKLEGGRVVQRKCTTCGQIMYHPIIVSREHMEAFETLLEIAKEYLDESGATKKMLESIITKINDRLNIQ